ncbi:hypothetical protein ACOSQ2_007978 [Xanthoceras sorbifolium]|uniref:RNA helicase n=1 Tax=Xanthoceras sorbifolium TaxID=99658 RepID=A0ABQ8IAY4_9ROSI|nr:hypothetical protein JRO89_XS03G0210700 [Xanthoceras sorbifolium]
MGTVGDKWDGEFSVIADKGEISYIDYEDDKSVCSYNPSEEGPIVISVPFPFVDGKPQSVRVGERTMDSITIKNTTDEAVDLWTKIYASNPTDTFTLSVLKPPSANSDSKASQGFLEFFVLEDRMLQPGQTLTIWLSCKPQEIGLHTTVVQFDVGDRFERVVFLLAEDNISMSLASKMPYSRGGRKKQFSVETFVKASRPTGVRKQPLFKNRLPRYDIPKDVRELIESKQIPDAIEEGLTRENYASYFKTLLIMEELQLEEDMRAYDMESVTMTKKGKYFLSLVVPGLAERRPSLVHGDFIFVKLACEDARDETSPYQGYIHRVEADEVYVKFAEEFHLQHRDGDLYNVQFTYNRVNMRRLYQAIDAANSLDTELLFPSDSCKIRLIETTPLIPISCNINEEQMFSIEKILGCRGAPPYLIHGPPGTGKTMTLVEAILQLYKTREDSRILVCAPSNSAADHILEKLLGQNAVKVHENEIFRLNAPSRAYEDVKPEYIRFCFFDEYIFKCPPLRALTCYRIIISTYMSTCLLYAEGVNCGHFSHIFLDEAGQASEPESMVPLSLCQRETVVVLAGDPMQLGPVIHSREAQSYGLGKSYLERLHQYESYYSGDENYVTRLVRNYRSHHHILYLPSKLFYEEELIACRDNADSLLTSLNFLPNKEFPVTFFGIQGCDEREGSNPSWFNRFEVSKVVEVIRRLTANEKLAEEDIGVITPYRQQVLKIKNALESFDMSNIKVGSVEQFQGQERQVIIVSTVRSTVKHNDFDRKHCLGFLSNPRRFNVAVTRAISLLLVIGNPHIVSKDPYWNKLLWYCSDNDSYQGCGLPERQEDFDEDPAQDNFLNYKEEISQPTEQDEWNQESFQPDLPKPVKDEDEWSDGWR